MLDLFQAANNGESWIETICPDAVVLRQYATNQAPELLDAINTVTKPAPFRQMQTPGGFTMSAAITACGDYGWVSDHQGYCYSKTDPQSGLAWPEMPKLFYKFAHHAAATAGFSDFYPDVCLINRYAANAKMSLHQDRHERDLSAPIVSVSLGVPATFLFGGKHRSDSTKKIPLIHGDVVVWGGESRLCFHGITPIKEDYHPLVGHHRLNITFRKAR